MISTIFTTIGNIFCITGSSLFHQGVTLPDGCFFVYIYNSQRLKDRKWEGRVHKCS